MIVKIDIGDNDFAETIANNLEAKVFGLITIVDDYFYQELKKNTDTNDLTKLEEYRRISILRDEIRNFFMDDKEVLKGKRTEIANVIKNAVIHLISNSFSQKDLDYLKGIIKISFPKTMKAEWENGEVIYYCPNTYSKNKFMLF